MAVTKATRKKLKSDDNNSEPTLAPITIFIGAPVGENDKEQILNGYNTIGNAIKKVFDSSDQNFNVAVTYPNPEWNLSESVEDLGKAIQMMGEADAIFLTDNWAAAKECIVLREIATLYKFPVLELLYDEKKEE